MDTNNIRERIAAIQHEQWSGWMKYLFSKCKRQELTSEIPKVWRDRWERQIDTPYSQLTDKEQESDRVEADKLLQLIKSVCEEVLGENEEYFFIERMEADSIAYIRNELRSQQRQRLSELLGEENK